MLVVARVGGRGRSRSEMPSAAGDAEPKAPACGQGPLSGSGRFAQTLPRHSQGAAAERGSYYSGHRSGPVALPRGLSREQRGRKAAVLSTSSAAGDPPCKAAGPGRAARSAAQACGTWALPLRAGAVAGVEGEAREHAGRRGPHVQPVPMTRSRRNRPCICPQADSSSGARWGSLAAPSLCPSARLVAAPVTAEHAASPSPEPPRGQA